MYFRIVSVEASPVGQTTYPSDQNVRSFQNCLFNSCEKISNKRKDFLHKTSAAIIKQYDTICLGNLNVQGMQQNRKLSLSIADVSGSAFTNMLEYKSAWYGKNVVHIGRFEPSSKICSKCGNIFKEPTLSDRVWTCGKCGTGHDRDHNTAKNIKNFGLWNKPAVAKVSQQAML